MDQQPDYAVTVCPAEKLTDEERATCIAILKEGKAVNIRTATQELPHSLALVLARQGGEIVGVGTIKRARSVYAGKVSRSSGETVPAETPELGYVAVTDKHKGQHLSSRIVSALLASREGALFATTDDDKMKHLLKKGGFTKKGKEWKGDRGALSLWRKE